MIKIINIILILIVGCNCCLLNAANNEYQKSKIKNIILQSDDPYSLLMKTINMELHSLKINVVHNSSLNNKLPILKISKLRENQIITLPIINNNIKEYQLNLSLKIMILTAKKKQHLFNVEVNRSFFDIPSTLILAKYSKKELKKQEMYKQAAQIITKKLLSI